MLATGERAPDFELPNQNGETVSLSEFDRPLVLYFYPKAGTDSCTTEAERFEAELEEFQDAGLTVVGVSTDTVDEISDFHQQHDLSFQLLSDADTTVTKQYDTFGTPEIEGVQYEIALRNTYVIDEDDTIILTYEDVSPTEHPEEIIADHTN
jgi:peroxiredoxin Q/BCP